MNSADLGGQKSRSKLYRIPSQARIMGVCAGIAHYFGISSLIVRVIAVICLISFPVAALIAYFLAGLLLDVMPEHLFETQEEETFWRGVRTDPAATCRSQHHNFRELELRLRRLETYITSTEFELNRELRNLES